MRDKGEREFGEASVGQKLEQAREKLGLSLEDVEQAIKVHAHQLKALERDDPDALPSPALARGLSIMYAKFLGLDVKALGLVREPESLRLLWWERYLSRHWRGVVVV